MKFEDRDLNFTDERIEKAVLGEMLSKPTSLAEGCDLLRESDFGFDSNRKIFRSIVAMAMAHDECDTVTLAAWMKSQGQLDEVGGYNYIAELPEYIVRGSLKPHSRALRETSRRRQLASSLYLALTTLADGAGYKALSEAVQESLADIEDEGQDLVTAAMAAQRVRESIAPETAIGSLPTGIMLLDVMTGGGLKPGRMWVDGALPARGKSSFGRQIAALNLRNGVPTLIFSIEMSVEEWFGIDAANMAGVPAWKLQEPRHLKPEDRTALESTLDEIGSPIDEGGWPVWFDDNGEQTINKMMARARLAVLRYGVKLIVVDYLQRIDGGGKDELRTRVGRVAQKFAAFAKRYKVAVLLLSQLSRPKDINERPSIITLKESGDIEAHAHVIVLNYRPIDKDNEQFSGQDELLLVKNRFGKPGKALVQFDGDTMTFKERA